MFLSRGLDTSLSVSWFSHHFWLTPSPDTKGQAEDGGEELLSLTLTGISVLCPFKCPPHPPTSIPYHPYSHPSSFSFLCPSLFTPPLFYFFPNSQFLACITFLHFQKVPQLFLPLPLTTPPSRVSESPFCFPWLCKVHPAWGATLTWPQSFLPDPSVPCRTHPEIWNHWRRCSATQEVNLDLKELVVSRGN